MMPGTAQAAPARVREERPENPDPTFEVLGVRVHAVQIPDMISRM